MKSRVEVAFVGGGLANGLAAYRLQQRRPETSFVVLEKDSALGGHHTWSFHDADLAPSDLAWVKPLISKSWPSHRLEFSAYARSLRATYHSIRSGHFSEVIARALGDRLVTGAAVKKLSPHGVELADGKIVAADCVVDGRGWIDEAAVPRGYQKFFGQVIETTAPHGLTEPVLMDARCPQLEGFRFFYLLPWSATEVLIEDTRYSETPDQDLGELRREIAEDARRRGWSVKAVVYEERGILPIPLSGQMPRWEPGVLRSGTRAGLFHATTGYSLPEAVRYANRLAALPSFRENGPFVEMKKYVDDRWRKNAFFRLLNRMMFRAADPDQRFRIFEKFYRLPGPLIERFYALDLTVADRARIFLGKPPVPVSRAMRCLFHAS